MIDLFATDKSNKICIWNALIIYFNLNLTFTKQQLFMYVT